MILFVVETFDSNSKNKKSLWSEIFDDVKDELSEGSLSEIGNGIISLQLADLNANKSVFLALTNSKFCILHRKNLYHEKEANPLPGNPLDRSFHVSYFLFRIPNSAPGKLISFTRRQRVHWKTNWIRLNNLH